MPSRPNPASPQDLDSSIERDQTAATTPGWVKVSVVIVLLRLVLFVILHSDYST